MAKPTFIAGDWGTSRLRLFLCDVSGNAVARAEGPGAAAAGTDSPAILRGLVADWDQLHGTLPVVLSGMVGSTIGWREVPYVACPASPAALAEGSLRFSEQGRSVALVPGMSCGNLSGVADVMRGEETQILGALRLDPTLALGRHLFCLPGTHTKWVAMENGVVTRFQTALTGELFDLLSRHSVLARDSEPVSPDHAAFAQGLALAQDRYQDGLLHLLFSTRSRQLFGDVAKPHAASYLSGLIVGSDVAAALRLFQPQERIVLICTPALAALYGHALTAWGLSAYSLSGDDAALAGLGLIHDILFGGHDG